ncbi:MAG: BatD family protein [Verrucomicrobiota bacterium]
MPLLVLGTWHSALGGSVEFDIQPRVLRVGEVAICSITVRDVDNPPAPALPPIQGFQISMAGTERSFSFGSAGKGSSVTFRYQFLPLQTGKFTIGPFAYTLQGQTENLPAIELQVLAPESAAPSAQGAQPEWSELLFAEVSVGETNIYSQQVFDLKFSIFSRGLNLAGDMSLLNMPTAGLTLQPFQELPITREVVRNQIYDVRRFRCRAQALSAGTFKLAPTVRVGLLIPRERRRDPFFGGFDDSFFDAFFGRTQAKPVDLVPQPIELVVHTLPSEGQPPNFSGAVGRFSFDTQVKPTELSAGDPITLTMQISGEGNLENLSAPQVLAGDNFKVYEPRLASKNIDESQAAGTKVFEQVVIPRSQEVTNLPALTFAYFDPSKGAYETVTRGPFALTVHPSSNAAAKMIQAPANLPEARTILLGTDIVYLKPAPARWTHVTERAWYDRPLFLALQLVPAMATAFLFLSVRRRERLARDVALARRQRAPRTARAAVKKAEAAIARSERQAFFEAVWEALASYFGDRLNLSPGEVTGDAVMDALIQARMDDSARDQVRQLFETCERERFGQAGGAAVMTPADKAASAELLAVLNRVLRSCERIRL